MSLFIKFKAAQRRQLRFIQYFAKFQKDLRLFTHFWYHDFRFFNMDRTEKRVQHARDGRKSGS